MKLLLDEMYVGEIAAHLRARGHDVVSVHAREDLLGSPDAESLGVAVREGRVLVTENVRDFAPLVQAALLGGETTPGVIYGSPRRMPRFRATVGTFVERLDGLLTEHPGRGPPGGVAWLQPAR